jgi:hypothetical protein
MKQFLLGTGIKSVLKAVLLIVYCLCYSNCCRAAVEVVDEEVTGEKERCIMTELAVCNLLQMLLASQHQ